MILVEPFWSPSGMYVCARQEVGRSDWIVRVYDFATWKHRTTRFPTPDAARSHADLWRI